MSDPVIVKLSRRYEVPDHEPFNTVQLRRPVFNDLFAAGLGRPFDYHPTRHGVVVVRYPEVLNDYAKRLVVRPGYEAIGHLDLVDALALEEAIHAFFTESTTPQQPHDGSSSEAVSGPPTSAE